MAWPPVLRNITETTLVRRATATSTLQMPYVPSPAKEETTPGCSSQVLCPYSVRTQLPLKSVRAFKHSMCLGQKGRTTLPSSSTRRATACLLAISSHAVTALLVAWCEAVKLQSCAALPTDPLPNPTLRCEPKLIQRRISTPTIYQ